MKKYCLVVDPYSSSSFLATTLLENNIIPIAVPTPRQNISEETLMARCGKYPYMVKYTETDERAFFEKLSKFSISYVIGGTEGSLDVADKLAMHFTPELANPSSSSAARAFKYEMQEAVRRATLNAVRQFKMFQIKLTDEQKVKLTSWGFPVVVKPNISAGGIDVSICKTVEEIEEAASKIIHKTSSFNNQIADCAVVQECLIGEEYAINSVSLHGKSIIVCVHHSVKQLYNKRKIYRYNEFLDPASSEAKKISEYIKNVLKATELNNGFGHCEVFLTPEPYLIEINPRIAGASGMVNRLTSACIGENQITLMAQSINDPAGFLKRCEEPPLPLKRYGRMLQLQNWTPKVIGKLNMDTLKQFPSYLDSMQLIPPGTSMGEPDDVLDTVGAVLLAHSSKEQLVADTEAIFQLEKEGKLF